jgi:ABC-type transport system substrate-binding protein
MPGLAQNWTVSSNDTLYTLNLRQNVTFSNGDAFNAYQVWMEMYGYYFLSYNSSTFINSTPLFDTSTVNFGPATIAKINQSGLLNPNSAAVAIMSNQSWPIYVTGPNQIVFRMIHLFAYFTSQLIQDAGLIYDAQYVLNHGGFGNASSINTAFNLNPIPGTGPYIVKQVAQNSFVEFTLNPTYWGLKLSATQNAMQPLLQPGKIPTVVVNYKADDLTRYADLSSGAAQIADIQASDWNLITANPSQYSYVTLPPWAGEVSLLGLNTQVYPTNITWVRQAIVHAINYTEVSQKAYLGQMTPYVGPEYPAQKTFYDLGGFQPYSFNLTLAKADLAKANITNMPTLMLPSISGCQSCTNGAQAIQSDLQALGINVQITVETPDQFYSVHGTYGYTQSVANQTGQLSWVDGGAGWGNSNPGPSDYWSAFVSNQSNFGNFAIYYNPTVQKCVDSFVQTSDESLIKQLCTAAQAQIYNDAPYAWIGQFKLWLPAGGSTVWSKNVISSFLLDPDWSGQTTLPYFNTIVFA